jgi:hypothetical protein
MKKTMLCVPLSDLTDIHETLHGYTATAGQSIVVYIYFFISYNQYQ